MNIIPITFPTGSSLSNPVNLCGKQITSFIMPDQWTPANLTFMSSLDGQNWKNVFNMLGTEVTAPVAASQHIVTDSPSPILWDNSDGTIMSLWWLRLRSGSSSSPVNQVQETTILLATK